MKPVTVSTVVDRPQEEVFAFLDVLGNHRAFTDHLLVDWTLSGAEAGVGTHAHMRVKTLGPAQWLDMETLVSEPPSRTVERSVSAGGKRVTTGTYELAPADGGGTLVTFTFRWEQPTRGDRVTAPFVRAFMRRGNGKAMERLKALLEANPQPASRGSDPLQAAAAVRSSSRADGAGEAAA
jgi:ligand-binding SRPBCC domain-containing protein